MFHVTVAPGLAVVEKCKRNLEAGARVLLLVPDAVLMAARQIAQEMVEPGRVAVEGIESFVANNIEEMARFRKGELVSGFRRLLETYNRRVDAIELDKSLLIEMPPTLG